MYNMNWREALKKTQSRIDQLLDIKQETEEEIEEEQDVEDNHELEVDPDSDISPTSTSPESPVNNVVVVEPVLPPSSTNYLMGDDIQTIVSSDIEMLPENFSLGNSLDQSNFEELPLTNEVIKPNSWLKEKLEKEKRKTLELKEHNTKLSAKSNSIEKEFESFKLEAAKFSQEAFKARQDAKASRQKITELTKELADAEEKLQSKETKMKGMKHAMEDNLAIVKKYTTSNASQSETIKKLTIEIEEKNAKISSLETTIAEMETLNDGEKAGNHYIDDMMEQSLRGLKMEVEEYKTANANLQESYKNLELLYENKQLEYNENIANAIQAATSNSHDEISMLKSSEARLKQERDDLEKKEKKNKMALENTMHIINSLRHDMNQLSLTCSMFFKNSNAETLRLFSDVESAVKKVKMMKKPAPVKVVPPKPFTTSKYCQTEETNTTTPVPVSPIHQSSEVTSSKHLKEKDSFSNSATLLTMIDQLTCQRDQLETIRRTLDLELRESRRQLSEILVMHGEKIEELEELKIDNEDLKCILKEQALSLTSSGQNE